MGEFAGRLAAARAGSHAVIDLDAYAGNLRRMRARLPQAAALMAVVKANAYGHGLLPIAQTAVEAGADWLGVARIEEGLLLRQAGIETPVLVLGPPNPALLAQAVAAGLDLAAGSSETVAAIAAAASARQPARVHLKLDSGMHRYGVEPEGATALARTVAGEPRLVLAGLFTHFATADEPGGFMAEQIRRFESARAALAAAGIAPPLLHYANSAATLRGALPAAGAGQTAIVRCGYALYGLSPSAEVPVPPDFRPVLSLHSRLARVFTLPAGEGVSYGLSFVAERPLRCATLPLGYGDGLPRALSNRGWALVNGAACPIRGRVCMDQLVIEVEDAGEVREGDAAIIYGAEPGAMTVDDAAALCGGIGYEIVTALSARLPRVSLRHGQPAAVSDLLGLVTSG
ncbi:MAG TPA: alanine racemase [Thermomicrobiaceae bacterium]|nr:alanine racemase [Thermomicrobiaceae bacterium]